VATKIHREGQEIDSLAVGRY